MSKAALASLFLSLTFAATLLLLLVSPFATANQTKSAFVEPLTRTSSVFTGTRTFYANDDHNSNNNKKEKEEPIMKAWTCHGKNQRDLVDRLFQASIIKSDSVRDVLYKVDRKNFAPGVDHAAAYMDSPQPIGQGQTISAPHMHAHVLEEIYPYLKKSSSNQLKLLDVGCGSGYLTAALGRWVAPLSESDPESSILDDHKTGKVYGIDIFPYLVDLTRRNMEKGDRDLLDKKIVTLSHSNGWKGLPDDGPFDAIHVGAAAADFPRPLLEQLKVGGVLLIPVGPEGGVQNLYRVERKGDGLTQEDFGITELLGVRYVPLVDREPNEN